MARPPPRACPDRARNVHVADPDAILIDGARLRRMTGRDDDGPPPPRFGPSNLRKDPPADARRINRSAAVPLPEAASAALALADTMRAAHARDGAYRSLATESLPSSFYPVVDHRVGATAGTTVFWPTV